MAKLFTPIQFRELIIKNRIFVSPMCQYSSVEGVAQPWHMTHLGSRAVGGAGLVIVEATGVNAEGRISPGDMGLWNEKQMQALAPIAAFIKSQGAAAGIQIAHAGRKASTDLPWKGGKPLFADNGGWVPVGPSAIAYHDGYCTPIELTPSAIEDLVKDFENSSQLALQAGFQVVELHMAHGYLLHNFLSPLSNHRTDDYGGSLQNRMRFPLMVAQRVRQIWPQNLPVFVRISATDWADGGWDLEQSTEFCKALKLKGIDMIDCSSGGLVHHQKIKLGPGYQVPFAAHIRKEADMPTGAVGLITEAQQAEQILAENKADVVLLARELLRDPYWPLHAAKALGVDLHWPAQYDRAAKS